jgi:hypothetical protein
MEIGDYSSMILLQFTGRALTLLLAKKLKGVDVDTAPEDFPATSEERAAWREELAKSIVDQIWLKFPHQQMEAILQECPWHQSNMPLRKFKITIIS